MTETQDPLIRMDTPKLERQIGNGPEVSIERNTTQKISDAKHMCWSPATKTGFQRWSIGLILLGLIILAIFLWSFFDNGHIVLTVMMGLASFLILVYIIVGLIWFQPDEDCY